MKVAQTCKVAHAWRMLAHGCDWNLYALAQSYLGCGVARLIAHLQACAIIPRLRACTLNRALAQSYLGCGSARLIACLQSCAIIPGPCGNGHSQTMFESCFKYGRLCFNHTQSYPKNMF